jgi:DNA-directed RNA polymerase subunit RPC12/RpoP
MGIRITKTGQQAEYEKIKQRKEARCPECGHGANFASYSYRTVKESIFHTITKKVRHYSCFECGCEWEID